MRASRLFLFPFSATQTGHIENRVMSAQADFLGAHNVLTRTWMYLSSFTPSAIACDECAMNMPCAAPRRHSWIFMSTNNSFNEAQSESFDGKRTNASAPHTRPDTMPSGLSTEQFLVESCYRMVSHPIDWSIPECFGACKLNWVRVLFIPSFRLPLSRIFSDFR